MSSSARLYSVFPHHVSQVWPDVHEFLSDAIQHCDGKWELIDVRRAIESKDMQLFVVMDGEVKAAVVTQFNQYPAKKVLTVVFLGGRDMERWLHLIEELERWARDEGCDSMEVHGRSGWERVLGWEKVSTVIRKKLEG